MKCLVTGGAGFIGSHIVDWLVDKEHDVVVLDDMSGGFSRNVNMKAKLSIGSITDARHVDHTFKVHKCDYVYHCAAYAAEGMSHFIRRFNYENNLIGSVNLINASVRYDVKCFVFLSSIAVYGRADVPDENVIPHPIDPYGISKYAVELDLQAAHEMFGLNYIIFRSHNVYGERQNIMDPYRNVIGIFMNQLLNGKPLTIFGDGEQTRAFTYIHDIAYSMADSVLDQSLYNEIYNIGSDNICTVNDIALQTQMAMNVFGRTIHLPARNEVTHIVSDHAKFQRAFGCSNTPLTEGLKRMATWAKNTDHMVSKPFENVEIEKNMPESWRGICPQQIKR